MNYSLFSCTILSNGTLHRPAGLPVRQARGRLITFAPTHMPLSLSVVLPAYNEEANIETTVRELLAWMRQEGIDGEIIVTNDGSKDATGEILRRMAQEIPILKIVTHEVNKGYGSAVRSGLDRAAKEWIGYMDSDGQFKASDFGKLLPYLGEYRIVTGRRRKRADPFMRKINAKGFAFLNLVLLGIWVRDINCAMKIFHRSIWQKIRPEFSTGALINAEIFYRARRNSIRWKQVFVEHYPRRFGAQTGANLKVILTMFRDMWRLRTTWCRSL